MHKRVRRAGFRERQFNTGETEINYIVGPRAGPALVLVPAQMGTWESYERVLPPLSQRFQVYAVDLRGHGKSDWTTGDYSWASVGRDMSAFLSQVVERPAIVSGNSSGGLVALWLAANMPQCVAGIVFEDAPVFSAEMPRFRDRDRFVYQGLVHLVSTLGDPENRDWARYFAQEVPRSATGKARRIPDWFVTWMAKKIRVAETVSTNGVIQLTAGPATLRRLVRSLSTFDPDFARAFVDGRFYGDFDHAQALSRVKCPVLVLHANWFRHPDYGLVGAMDDSDAKRIIELVPDAHYQVVKANHVIHSSRPRAFVKAICEFAQSAYG